MLQASVSTFRRALRRLVLLLAGFGVAGSASAFTLNVVGPNGQPITGYRWLVEEDPTYDSKPGVPTPQGLGVSIQKSHAPVVAAGDNSNSNINLPTNKRYFVSVLPNGGYALGGAPVSVNQSSVTVTLQPLPMPTAQISVQVFDDVGPINNLMDAGENGLSGFTVVIDDTFGQVLQDAFGNPLGTTYEQDAGGQFVLDAQGNPQVLNSGSGAITTGACPGPDCGIARVKYIAPGKYGIHVVPPAGQGWQQTSTIEGTKTIDAWVMPNEPAFYIENGPPGHHAFFGFVRAFADPTALNGGSNISGRIVNMHMSRPPEFTFSPGHAIPSCWVGLNELAAGVGRGVYAAPCDDNSGFSIQGVPPGDYQLAIWDANLDVIFATQNITVNADGTCRQDPDGDCAFGDVPVFNWFGRLENYVFLDADQDGFPDPGEEGMQEQNINIRFRDGTIYQAFPTDLVGYVPFDQVFPFFKFLVAEVDFARFKATGVTVVVDAGGAIPADNSWTMPSGGMLNPQAQIDMRPGSPTYRQPVINPNTFNNLSRTETGPVLTQAFQAFLGTTNVLHWGKAPYGAGENGGISGIVYYAVTRAEDDPRYAAADPWEPGVPRVQVALYQDANGDGIIDDFNGNGPTLADVDNYPLGNFPGPEDIDRNGNRFFNTGDAIQIVHTDSWDDAPPTGCIGEEGTQQPFYVHGDPATRAQDCFEGLRTFNQVRPGVFDGGYAFTSHHPGGMLSGSAEVEGVPPGSYIVEAAVPRGYVLAKEEDRNVDFGDSYVPSPLLLPPVCVGDNHVVPAELTLFPGEPAPFAGTSRPLCDRKQVALTEGKNAAADFFVFTLVPKAAFGMGMVLDDLGNEFNQASPAFGEKFGPPWMPIAVRDFTGKEITRVYTDEWGNYNVMVPSTYTTNLPTTSGVAQGMFRVCLNDPGPIADPANPGATILDPAYQPQYTRFCYPFNFSPGRTTFTDTPILPNAAFTGSAAFPLDCEFPTATPVIRSVSGPVGGPYVSATGEVIEILSQGLTTVPNPAYDPAVGTPATIVRDFGFGTTPGTVRIGELTVPAGNVNWSDGRLLVTVPAGAQTGQITVVRGDNGVASEIGVTLTIGGSAPIHVTAGGSIQAAIDGANPGDLILVAPGAYNERVILWKDVRLQGWGATSTFITDNVDPAASLNAWRIKVGQILASNAVDLVPGQNATLVTEEAAAMTVLAPAPGKAGQFSSGRIDGFTLSGAGSNTGGGVFINGYAHGFTVSNNRITTNRGTYGGGIRVGHPEIGTGLGTYQSAFNDNVRIHHNQVTFNAGMFGAGGGISLYTGSTNYAVTENLVCGNFSAGNGGGIGHQGLSQNGRIERNKVLFNESFNQLQSVNGGGVFVGGVVPMGEGAGSVRVFANHIQGNQAGAGDGGGLRAQFVNGADVAASPNDQANWHALDVLDNIIVNNVAGLAGGGISLQDTVKASIVNDTVARNDSSATAGQAFAGNPNVSTAQPAGIVARAHSAGLAQALGGTGYAAWSDPLLVNTIVWQNRSFWYDTAAGAFGGLMPDLGAGQPAQYAELAVLGAAGTLSPLNCLLTDATGYHSSNITADPRFQLPYFNGSRGAGVSGGEFTTGLNTAVALDEGGNYIDVAFGPLTRFGNYHLWGDSPAVDAGHALYAALSPSDIDGQARVIGAAVDMGADEVAAGTPTAPADTPVGALGSVGVTHVWQTVPMNLTANVTAPVIIAGPASFNGSQPGIIRLRNVSTTGFQAQFKEWDYLDGWHGSEQFSWMALQPGRYALPDGSQWEVGVMSVDGTGTWKGQTFSQAFPGRPYLFLTAQTANGGQAVAVRARNVSGTGFQAALFEQQSLMDGHIAETVAYLAVYQPAGTGSVQVGGTAQSYSLERAQVDQVFKAVLAGTARLKIEEEQSADAEIWHQMEDVDVLGLGAQIFGQDTSTRGLDPAAVRRR